MFRRFSSSSQPPRQEQQQPPARSQSQRTPGSIGTNNPYRTTSRNEPPELSGLSLDEAPPPPSYNAALRSSLDGSLSYAPPSHPPPPSSSRPQSIASQHSYQQPIQQQQQYAPPPQQGGPPPGRPLSHQSSVSPSSHQQPIRGNSGAPDPGRALAQDAGLRRRASVEDPLAALGKYDCVILVDDSPSMYDKWDETRDALMGVVEASVKYDKDGIDIFFMNNDHLKLKNVTDSSTVREAFHAVELMGSTPVSMSLDDILRDYCENVELAKAGQGPKVKPMICVVLTDGRADDPEGVKDLIVEMAGRLDDTRAPPFQLGVQFLQVGNDPEASDFLASLDDDLKEGSGVRDIVDTTPYSGQLSPDWILKAMLGAVNRRLDNQ